MNEWLLPSPGMVGMIHDAALNPGELERLPPNRVLIPGMPVETFLRTENRTPIAYLVKPLADYFNRAFRES